jgi:hypothetical protein
MRRLMRFESVTVPRASEIDMTPSRRSAPATLNPSEASRLPLSRPGTVAGTQPAT